MQDAVVVGSGPNGLAAAVTLIRAGLSVTVLDAEETIGGGARTLDLGLAEGVVHDLCSAVHPMAWASPFFNEFDLAAAGVDLLTPEVSYAQPLDDRPAAIAYRSMDATVERLGRDGAAWRSLLGPIARRPHAAARIALDDHRSLPPVRTLPTGLRLLLATGEQGTRTWGLRFRDAEAPALLTGVAMHTVSRLPGLVSAGTSVFLGALGHAGRGWPIARGGSGSITAALAAEVRARGGEIITGHRVSNRTHLPPARTYLFDTTPRTVIEVVGDRISPALRRALGRFRHGDGVTKIDFVLSGPVPWADPEVAGAGTVHLGGTRDQIARAESDVMAGRHPERPVCLISDPTVVDPGRECAGLRPLWSYTHVPAGSTLDQTSQVIAEIERHAPGFSDLVVASRCVPASRMVEHNQNYVGGDFTAGAMTPWQMIARPAPRWNPYRLGQGIYLCSSSTPPGPGVHGMCGRLAARRVLREVFGQR
ncbi:NAD(P)/FAD-dependent oxidoreductase [Microlunatus sp. Gsoil 973]|uniref:phytoene desaturase family protein n=1 Tax=Microlunatus sp. Gsoil 973 TaxID=2672569 RepID=UPI0012B485A8|nr:NAD(P)/FAD-dependent oxidoreductase [Microlunatus sp. Gsoil 973]QGN33394.1 NAD(P)-binding protein [Microlunatus sp. Gsoil 973]